MTEREGGKSRSPPLFILVIFPTYDSAADFIPYLCLRFHIRLNPIRAKLIARPKLVYERLIEEGKHSTDEEYFNRDREIPRTPREQISASKGPGVGHRLAGADTMGC